MIRSDSHADNPPVLVLGSSLTGVGVLRSLVSAGLTAFTVCPTTDLSANSRWYKPLPGTDGRCPLPSELPDFLEGLSLPTAVLIPCADDWANALAALHASLKRRFPTCISSPEVIETMVDKWKFAKVLDHLLLPHPTTMLVHTLEEMRAIPEDCYAGTFLKPLNSQAFNLRHGIKAFLIKDKAEALAIMRKGEGDQSSDFPILIQEYIPGPPTNHYFVDGFVDRFGNISALFPRRRLRMYPPLLGNSTLMKSVPQSEVRGAIKSLIKLHASSGYRGIFSAEFKLDDRDGLFKLIEVNARPWWFIEFATRAGVNFCSLAYADALGLPVPPAPSYDIGRRCVYLPNDIKLYRSSPRGFLESVRWGLSVIGADESAFRWSDPKPALIPLRAAWRATIRKP